MWKSRKFKAFFSHPLLLPHRGTRIGVIICKVHIYSEAVFPSDAAYIREADGEAGLHQLASGTLSQSGMGPSFV